MRTRTLAAAVLLAASVAAPAAEAKHRKPLSGSYDLVLPVPFPAEAASGSHCADAPDDLSRDTRPLTLPSSGRLKVALSEYAGDWIVELWDPKGRFVAYGAALSTGGPTTATMTYRKKSRASETYTLAVCNYTGGPNSHVAWTFTFD